MADRYLLATKRSNIRGAKGALLFVVSPIISDAFFSFYVLLPAPDRPGGAGRSLAARGRTNGEIAAEPVHQREHGHVPPGEGLPQAGSHLTPSARRLPAFLTRPLLAVQHFGQPGAKVLLAWSTGTALLGRQDECALLDRLVGTARGGWSAVLVIRGEPGMGKAPAGIRDRRRGRPAGHSAWHPAFRCIAGAT